MSARPHYPMSNVIPPGTRRCPLCNGTGLNPKLLTYVCPKCHGEKRVKA